MPGSCCWTACRFSMTKKCAVRSRFSTLYRRPQRNEPCSICFDQRCSVARTRPRFPSTDTTLSYEAFDRQTDAMAASLRGRGVARDVCVGVCLERSIDMVATVLAILKAGGAYVPMDPSYPTGTSGRDGRRFARLVHHCRVARNRETKSGSAAAPLHVLPYEDLMDATALG